MIWKNYFVTTLKAYGTDGHILADDLRKTILEHDGGEAYHGAYDLEERTDVSDYDGLMCPALGYVWFDFDSKDGGALALADTRAFVSWLGLHDVFICYSGSKGFHVGVPFSYFGLKSSKDLCVKLNHLASQLKLTYKTLDTTVYNANRKFRALGSRHPKTGLYKIFLPMTYMDAESYTLENIRKKAKERGNLEIPIPALRSPLEKLTHLLTNVEKPAASMSTTKPVAKDWQAPTGEAAFKQCGFLGYVKDHPQAVDEPQWYAALSIVSRFQEGRKQCHGISIGHQGYSANDCNQKIDQALELPPRTCESISKLYSKCAECPLFGKINSPVNLFERKFWDVSSKGALHPNFNDLLKEYVQTHPYKTIADMKAVYVYEQTHYNESTPIEIKAFAEQKFEPKPKEKERQEFCHKVFSNNVTRRTFFIETTENKINFKNGILDLSTGSTVQHLAAHNPAVGFRHCLPYEFNVASPCPTFDWWIKDVMLGDNHLVAILQEFMGYVVRGGDYKYHKALWLSGSGRNGKSTFLSVLKALIGTGNYSTLSIKQIINDKFASSDLDGKIANFSEETSPEELSDSGPFKNLTGDGELLAQKKYGNAYTFLNRAKLIMTYNDTPELRDLSPGMLSRPIIIPWEKDLTADELQDKGLKKKLLAELPGIFNFALAGWNRLEEQGHFTYSPKSALAKEQLREASCSALQWIENYVTFLPIDENSANREVHTPMELFEAYSDTERRFAYKAVKFFRRIGEHPEIKKRRRYTRKSTEYFSMIIRRRASFSAHEVDPKRINHNEPHQPQNEF